MHSMTIDSALTMITDVLAVDLTYMHWLQIDIAFIVVQNVLVEN